MPLLQLDDLETRGAIARARAVTQGGQEALQRLVLEHNVRKAENGDRAVWPAGADPQAYIAFRVPATGGQRPLTTVPYEEFSNSMVHVTREAHGADRDALVRETARLFGTGRLASVARPRLEAVLTAALREGRLALRDGTITATEPDRRRP